ncbi:hypothetical protein KKB40_05250 [Patescibacteria group bacterium]|nr:hypothetical protein [Patescibacteria group bacterium]
MSRFKTVLICESTQGGSDKLLLEELIKKHSLLQTNSYKIETKDPGSIDDVKEFLKTTLNTHHYIVSKETKNVLVIVDGDENPNRRFAEIRNCLDTGRFEIQRSINSILPRSLNKINVGIYLFPDCQNPGSLETLCLKTLKHNHLDSKLSCVDQYMTCIANLDGRMTANNKSKSKFRVFMATPKPDRYVSSIIDHTDFDSVEFNPLKDFIKQAQ